MKYINQEHKKFYHQTLKKDGIADTYRKALFYTSGIDKDCRSHIYELYDFENHQIKLSSIDQPWQTTGSMQCTLLAFNLYNGYIYEQDKQLSTPYDLFSSEYGFYFMESLKLRYPNQTKLKEKQGIR